MFDEEPGMDDDAAALGTELVLECLAGARHGEIGERAQVASSDDAGKTAQKKSLFAWR